MFEDLADLVDGHEGAVAAIIREGIEQHRPSVRDEDLAITEADIRAATELANVVENATGDIDTGAVTDADAAAGLGYSGAISRGIRQARAESGLPASTPEHSHIRLATKSELLDPDNPIDYLVLLLCEVSRYDGAWDGDEQRAAEWAVAQWCQELRWAPDLREFEVGEMVQPGDLADTVRLEDAFHYRVGEDPGEDDADEQGDAEDVEVDDE